MTTALWEWPYKETTTVFIIKGIFTILNRLYDLTWFRAVNA